MRVKRIVIAFCISCFLCGCGQNAMEADADIGKNEAIAEQVSENIVEQADVSDSIAPEDEYDLYYMNGEQIRLSELFHHDHLFYEKADVNGDGVDEIALREGRSGLFYLIDVTKKEVIYEGCTYDDLLDCDGYKGIIYYRSGGAPDHDDYRYTVFDENNNPTVVCEWGWCDLDNEGDFNSEIDENDLFYYKDDFSKDKENASYYEANAVDYNDWIKLTEEYMDLVDKAGNPRIPMTSVKGVLSDKDCPEVELQKKLEAFIEEKIEYIIKELRLEDYTPWIDYWSIIERENRENLYQISIATDSYGAFESGYFLEEKEEGMEEYYAYLETFRHSYSVYKGGYIQDCFYGGKSYYKEENLYFAADEMETVYSYETTRLKYYLEYEYSDVFGDEWCFPETYKETITDDIWEKVNLRKMVIGNKSVWVCEGDEDIRDSCSAENLEKIYEMLKESNLSEMIVLCKDVNEFYDKCKELITEKGYDIDSILENRRVSGIHFSYAWDFGI